jgi:hypothetical protein
MTRTKKQQGLQQGQFLLSMSGVLIVAVSEDAAARAHAEAYSGPAPKHILRTVSQRMSFRAARAVLSPDEWPMFTRLRQCKSDYIAALKVLEELERKYGLVAEHGNSHDDGGGSSTASGSGGGGGLGEGSAVDPGTLESVILAEAARYADARKNMICGKRCLHRLYLVGQEVARQSGALGVTLGEPSPCWTELRRTWKAHRRQVGRVRRERPADGRHDAAASARWGLAVHRSRCCQRAEGNSLWGTEHW